MGRQSLLLTQRAAQCATGMGRNAGVAPKVKVNIQNVDFLSWYFPPARGFFLLKAELLLLVVNQFEWAIASLLLHSIGYLINIFPLLLPQREECLETEMNTLLHTPAISLIYKAQR